MWEQNMHLFSKYNTLQDIANETLVKPMGENVKRDEKEKNQ